MIDSNTILNISYVFAAFTLFYTYQNDFNIFLLTFLLLLGALWCYLFIDEYITKFTDKMININKLVSDKIDYINNKLLNVAEITQQRMPFQGNQQNK